MLGVRIPPGVPNIVDKMKKLLILLIALITLFPLTALAVDLSWTNSDLLVNGEPIPETGDLALFGTEIRHSLCSNLDLVLGTLFIAFPNNTAIVDGLEDGEYCFIAKHIQNNGNKSADSNMAIKIVTTVVPNSPVFVTNTTVYTMVKITNDLLLLPVGTIPLEAECFDKIILEHNVVNRDEVIWSGNIQPLIVVAKC